MPELTLDSYSDALYERLPSLFLDDEQHGFFGKDLCKAIMSMLQYLDVITADTPTHPGWTIILDPLVCPEEWLPWCAQVYGVKVPPGLTIEEIRAYINSPPQEARGSTAAMLTEGERTLIGAKHFRVQEQLGGDAYKEQFVSATDETPNPALTLVALTSQKPGGVKLEFTVTESPLIDEGTLLIDEVPETCLAATLADIT